MTDDRASEAQIHRAAVQFFNLTLDPLVIWFHPANGGYRKRIEARIFKGMGVKAGVSDLLLIYRTRPTNDLKVLCIEIKSESGRQTEMQTDFACRCAYLGIPYEICRSLDDVIAAVKAHGVPLRADIASGERARAA